LAKPLYVFICKQKHFLFRFLYVFRYKVPEYYAGRFGAEACRFAAEYIVVSEQGTKLPDRLIAGKLFFMKMC
jgi:hypothetical protein